MSAPPNADHGFPDDVEAVRRDMSEFVQKTVDLLTGMGFSHVVLQLGRHMPSALPGYEGSLFAPGATGCALYPDAAPALDGFIGALEGMLAMMRAQKEKHGGDGEVFAGYCAQRPWGEPEPAPGDDS